MKRAFDFAASLILLVVLAGPLLILAVLVRFALGSPVIFRQRRPGMNERLFTMYKFRSMTDKTGPDGESLPDEIRLTRFGKLLRASSLDELPELWNVLKGDMSLVGPRPLLEEYLPLYTMEQRKRHRVRPGITGWAQVNGRNAIGWEQKFELDVWYVENASFWLDLKILAKTLAKVVVREGISASDHVTVEKFQGSEVGVGQRAGHNEE